MITVQKTSSMQTLIKTRLITFSLTASIGTSFVQHVSQFGAEAAPTAEASETEPTTGADESAGLIERKACNISKKSGGFAVLAQVLFDIRKIKCRHYRIDAFKIFSNFAN